MSWFTCICVYLTIWWTVLFAVLPWGVKSYAEAGITPPPGSDPGAPVEPKLVRKFITTSWVSAIVFAVLWVCIQYHLVKLPTIPGGLTR
jgi:predicted secreted protein